MTAEQLSNPLAALLVDKLQPCNCGGVFGQMVLSRDWVCFGIKPIHVQRSRRKKTAAIPSKRGFSYQLRRDLEAMAVQYPDGAIGKLAQAILNLEGGDHE